MFILLVLATVALTVAGAVLCFVDPSLPLRVLFVSLLAAGLAAAYWLTFYFEYQPRATVRIAGAPVPAAIFRLENGVWVDYVGGPGWMINLVLVPCLVVLPITLSLTIRAYRRWRTARLRGFPVLGRK